MYKRYVECDYILLLKVLGTLQWLEHMEGVSTLGKSVCFGFVIRRNIWK